jgi:hypothetical protein
LHDLLSLLLGLRVFSRVPEAGRIRSRLAVSEYRLSSEQTVAQSVDEMLLGRPAGQYHLVAVGLQGRGDVWWVEGARFEWSE